MSLSNLSNSSNNDTNSTLGTTSSDQHNSINLIIKKLGISRKYILLNKQNYNFLT